MLSELTSETNKEFFKTNKFVSDGYIDTYTIKTGQISLEFKKELNKITVQTFINILKDNDLLDYTDNQQITIKYTHTFDIIK